MFTLHYIAYVRIHRLSFCAAYISTQSADVVLLLLISHIISSVSKSFPCLIFNQTSNGIIITYPFVLLYCFCSNNQRLLVLSKILRSFSHNPNADNHHGT